MAGGQERILRRRIKTVESTKKITKAMELIAASRIVKAQQRVAAARPYSERITEVIRNLAAGGAGLNHPLLKPARRRPHRRLRRRSPPTAVSPVATTTTSSAPPSAPCAADRAAGPRDEAVRRRQEGPGLLPLPRHAHRGHVPRRHRPADVRAGARDRARGRRRVRGRRRSTRSRSSYTQFLSVGIAAGRRPPADAARHEQARRGGRERGHRELRVRARSRHHPRTAAAALRRGAAVRRAARRVGVRARRPPAGHEVGDRQRRRPHHDAEPRHEPRPPGRHHHRDHGDRRRRRGPAPGGERQGRPAARPDRPEDLLLESLNARN